MENIKSKGGTGKAEIEKRKALETDADNCVNIGKFFNPEMIEDSVLPYIIETELN